MSVQHLNLSPGMHPDIPEDKYHADLLMETPTLSRGEAVKLLDESALHLWCSHPRLGAKTFTQPTKKMDFGQAAHSMVLGKGQDIEVVEADNWMTKAAKEARESIRGAGKVPLLKAEKERADVVHKAFFHRLKEFDLLDLFQAGTSEVTLISNEGAGINIRARPDRLTILEKEEKAIIFDPKFCESANPIALGRQVMNMGYAVQDSWYRQVLQGVQPRLGGRIRFIFLFMETEYPYVMTPVELNGEFKGIGVSKMMRGIAQWKKCLEENRWPGYSNKIVELEPPAWALAQEMGQPSIR